MTERAVWIGWDPREAAAFAVAKHSMRAHLTTDIPIRGLVLDNLVADFSYTRPTRRDAGGKLFDVLSARADYDGAISTEHANARFLVPFLPGSADLKWAMFVDGDILLRADITELFDGLDDSFALYCVKHDYRPAEAVKMDGRAQTKYPRKNWSSVMVFNIQHPANRRLTRSMVNSLPGRELHAMTWLGDHEIGALDPKWNFLIGHSDETIDPALVHFTSGVPDMPGYGNVPFARAWREVLADWAQRG